MYCFENALTWLVHYPRNPNHTISQTVIEIPNSYHSISILNAFIPSEMNLICFKDLSFIIRTTNKFDIAPIAVQFIASICPFSEIFKYTEYFG